MVQGVCNHGQLEGTMNGVACYPSCFLYSSSLHGNQCLSYGCAAPSALFSVPSCLGVRKRERKSRITEWGEMLWELQEKKEKNTRKTQSSMDMAERSRDLAGSLESRERGRQFFVRLQGIMLKMYGGILQLMAVRDTLRHVNGSIPLCCAQWAEREVPVVEIVHGRCNSTPLCLKGGQSTLQTFNIWA